MSGHTPGPWTVNGAGGTFCKVARLVPAGVIVSANTIPQREEEIPNARLIAAAPDLLEACRVAVDADSIGRDGTGSVTEKRLRWDQAMQMIGAAIAKAEGK